MVLGHLIGNFLVLIIDDDGGMGEILIGEFLVVLSYSFFTNSFKTNKTIGKDSDNHGIFAKQITERCIQITDGVFS